MPRYELLRSVMMSDSLCTCSATVMSPAGQQVRPTAVSSPLTFMTCVCLRRAAALAKRASRQPSRGTRTVSRKAEYADNSVLPTPDGFDV